MKTVPVTLPDWVWGRAATIAEHRGVKVGDLIADGLMGVLDADTHRLEQLETALKAARTMTPTAAVRARSKGGRPMRRAS